MEQRRRVAHILFVFLPVFLLASPVYASMGDINICFPFFLLLAALMAAMLAQGKSPLVGFDISTVRPPAQIRSTSYHFKSFGAGGFETEMKLRDQMTGGTMLTRGAAWVANKAAQGGAKAVSKASGGKYASKQAKEGFAVLKTASKRGWTYAATKHSQKAQVVVKKVGGVVKRVPIVGVKWKGVGKGKYRISKALPVGLKADRKGTGWADTGVAGGGHQAEYLRRKWVAQDKYPEAESKMKESKQNVKSLRTQLQKLGKGRKKDTVAKRNELKKKLKNERENYQKYKSQSAEIQVWESARKGAEDYGRTLAEHAGVKGFIKAPLYPLAVAGGLVASGALLPGRGAKRKIEKYLNEKKLDHLKDKITQLTKETAKLETEISTLENDIKGLKKKLKTKGLSKADEAKLKNNLETLEKRKNELAPKKKQLEDMKMLREYLKNRDKQLSRKSMFSNIFGQYGNKKLTAKDVARGTGKQAIYTVLWGLPNQLLPIESLRGVWKKYKSEKPQIQERAANATDHVTRLKDMLGSLEDPNMDRLTKLETLREAAKLEKQIPKETRSGFAVQYKDKPLLRKALLNKDQKELNAAHNDVKNDIAALIALYKKGGRIDKGKENELRTKLEIDRFKRDNLIQKVGIPAEAHGVKDNIYKEKIRGNLTALLYDDKEDPNSLNNLKKEKKNIEKQEPSEDRKKKLEEVNSRIKERESYFKNPAPFIAVRIKTLEDRNKELSSDKVFNQSAKIAANNKEIESLQEIAKEKHRYKILSPVSKRSKDRLENWLKETKFSTDGKPVISDHERASSVALAKFLDGWREAKKESSGKYGIMNTPINVLSWGISGIEKAQEVRHMASMWENQLGPMILEIEKDQAKRDNLKKLLALDKEEEKKRSKRGIFKKDKSLIEQRLELTKELKRNQRELEGLTNPDNIAKTSEQIEKINYKINRINASIMSARSELDKIQRKIDDAAVFLLADQAQLAYRQREELRKGTSDLNISAEGKTEKLGKIKARIEKLDKGIEKNREKMELLNQNMENLEHNETNKPEYMQDPEKMKIALGLVHSSKEYKKLQKEFSELREDVDKKIKAKEEENNKIVNERARISTLLRDLREKTEIKVGGEEIYKKKDRINRELLALQVYDKEFKKADIGLVNALRNLSGDDKYLAERIKDYASDKEFGKEASKLPSLQIEMKGTMEGWDKIISNTDNSLYELKQRRDSAVEPEVTKIDSSIKELEKKKHEAIFSRAAASEVAKIDKDIKDLEDRKSELISGKTDPKVAKMNSSIKELENKKSEAVSGKAADLVRLEEQINKSTDELAKYYGKHIDDYKRDLKEARNKLSEQWDELETVNAADWIQKKMKEVGDPRWSRESGMYRDRFELSALTDREFQKDHDLTTNALKGCIQRDSEVVESVLYLANLEFTRVLDVGMGYKYDRDLVSEVKRMREASPEYAKSESKVVAAKMEVTEKQRDEAKKSGWTAEVERLNKRIGELKEQKEHLDSIVVNPPQKTVSYEELKKAEDKLIKTAHMHQAAELLQREVYSKERGGLMQIDTREKLNGLREKYGEDKTFWDDSREWAALNEQKDAGRLQQLMYKNQQNKLLEKRNEIKDVSNEISKIEAKPEYLNNQPMSEEDSNRIKSLIQERKEKQGELREIYSDWKEGREYYRSIHEQTRIADKFTGADSEQEMDRYLRGSADDIERGLWGGRFQRIAEPVSDLSGRVSTFAAHHGGKLLLAAAIASPFVVLPVAGAGAAAAVTYGSAGIWFGKAQLRKSGEQEQLKDGTTSQIIQWSSHLTGRGSGSPPSDWEGAWRSQTTGTEYITRGLRLNEYGEIKNRKENLNLPDVGLPWYIRWAKAPVEGATSTSSALVRRAMLRMEWWTGEEGLKRTMAENPQYIPEIEKKIQYQYIQPFGAAGPSMFPKQAWEMTEYKDIAMNVPFQEEVKHVVVWRSYAPDPLGMHFDWRQEGSYRPRTGGEVMALRADARFQDKMARDQASSRRLDNMYR